MGESRYAYRVLVGRPEGRRPLGRPRRRWEDNIKMDLREVGYDGRDWINLAQDRDQWRAYVRAAMNLRKSANTFLKNGNMPTFDLNVAPLRIKTIQIESLISSMCDVTLQGVALGGAIGIALAFCVRGCGFDPGPGRWYLSVLKCDRLMLVDLLYPFQPASESAAGHGTEFELCYMWSLVAGGSAVSRAILRRLMSTWKVKVKVNGILQAVEGVRGRPPRESVPWEDFCVCTSFHPVHRCGAMVNMSVKLASADSNLGWAKLPGGGLFRSFLSTH
ncbi:hypothetical protein ANN_23609 [Periplaneta americana]|uniref:Uncharacterized protein n=1 Tax=Periplaneta americana TaxID=6978 RepID=A0ABQ8SMU1_PERAM|nr:hypothetical protein ANN_23609 [Periplaneta americana]